MVQNASDQCAFVRANCPDEEAGLFSYLQLYYCKLPGLKALAFMVMVLWLGLLFSTIGIAASDFLCVNLSTIATILGMSESLTGVTFLAFGNGSPDVFSTFAAMSTHSGGMAVGELIGAAGFITAVVAGSMALVRPFRVARKSFVRDVGFFIVASSFSMVFLADGHLHLWECAVMVGFYVFYVVTVVVWHWILRQRRRRKGREAAARSEFHVPNAINDNDSHVDRLFSAGLLHRSRSRGPARETDNGDLNVLEGHVTLGMEDFEHQEDDETRNRWMAELSNNMRVKRPLAGDRRRSAKPIRPSLVGALEFRAILSSLHKSRNHQNFPINLRRHSDDQAYTLALQHHIVSSNLNLRTADPPVGLHSILTDDFRQLSTNGYHGVGRVRAVSANDTSRPILQRAHPSRSSIPQVDFVGPTSPSAVDLRIHLFTEGDALSDDRERLTVPSSPGSQASFLTGFGQKASKLLQAPDQQLSNHLAPPNNEISVAVNHHRVGANASDYFSSATQTSTKPSARCSQGTASSSPATPFPPFHDDPNFGRSVSQTPSIRLPTPSTYPEPLPAQVYDNLPLERTRGWPYSVLPPPAVLASTLFPTLYSWKDKGIGEKILALITAPSVFLLAITLPVVELERDNDDEDDDTKKITGLLGPESGLLNPGETILHSLDNSPTALKFGVSTTTLSTRSSAVLTQDIVSNEYRSGRESSSNRYGNTLTDGAATLEAPSWHHSANTTIDLPNPGPFLPGDWNRWLVSTQIFAAPLFVVLIIWANTDIARSSFNLIRLLLTTFAVSLLLFVLLSWTTSPVKAPRYRYVLCFLGFIVSIAWISTIANEVVGVLKAFGVILGISDAILGLTIFAVGNSLGDLVADITVAKLGYPVMALSACFGGPMLNILLGIGLSGLYMTIHDSNGRHDRHPDRPRKYKPYQVEIDGTLIISGITLLVTLVGLMIVVPLNKWMMDRKIGWALVILWCGSTVGNLIVESTGLSRDLTQSVA